MKELVIYSVSFLTFAVLLSATFSDESKTWEASDKAKNLVEETMAEIKCVFTARFGRDLLLKMIQ